MVQRLQTSKSEIRDTNEVKRASYKERKKNTDIPYNLSEKQRRAREKQLCLRHLMTALPDTSR